jgi:LCP family protein required for cell wall assembly
MLKKRRPLIIVGIIAALLALFLIYKTASIYPFLFHLLFDKGVALKQTDNRVNILLLGIGGGSHDGPNLTDTLILASLDRKNNKVTLISIPRDLWLPDLEGSNKKINGAYAFGESKRKGGGLALAKASVRKVTGQEVDYGVRIDFSGFVKAVDTVGGLDVNVEHTFDDLAYPISGKEDDSCGNTEEDIEAFSATASAEEEIRDKFSCRYKHLHFDKGLNHMDGETALEFVRSRHAAGVEGGDFARSKRQEKIINGFKEKVLSPQTLVNPGKLLELYGIVKDSIDTDVKQEEFDDFVRLSQAFNKAKIQSTVLDVGSESEERPGLLEEAPRTKEYQFLSVLIPRTGNGNFLEIHEHISCEITKGACVISKKPTN